MSKNKKKKRNSGPPQALIRLSQVMIVKNEEKNIEKALGWAKKIAYEQIVVDTGSTDKTVELAQKLGAKVVHFEWINDFGAAKNFAIEQASGNWIAFLDADEYFSDEDAQKLMIFLKRIESDPQMRASYHVLNCAWIQLDKDGNFASKLDQERVFRNIPSVRYKGRIHEQLSVRPENIVMVDEIEIMHTGYTDEAFVTTGKIQRNIRLLREDLALYPDDYNIKAYLADSLKKSEDEKEREEADVLFSEIVENKDKVWPDMLRKAYVHFMNKSMQAGDMQKCLELCKEAMLYIPGDPDLENVYRSLTAQS